MNLLSIPELDRLVGYMDAMSRCLSGANYVPWFSVRVVEMDEAFEIGILDKLAYPEATPALEIQKVIKLAYPGAKPDLATMFECHGQYALRINSYIAYLNPSDGLKNVDKYKKQDLIAGFWHHVSQCIDYEKSRAFQYNPAFDVDDELWDFIIWGFIFLLINQEQKRCLRLHGGASD